MRCREHIESLGHADIRRIEMMSKSQRANEQLFGNDCGLLQSMRTSKNVETRET